MRLDDLMHDDTALDEALATLGTPQEARPRRGALVLLAGVLGSGAVAGGTAWGTIVAVALATGIGGGFIALEVQDRLSETPPAVSEPATPNLQRAPATLLAMANPTHESESLATTHINADPLPVHSPSRPATSPTLRGVQQVAPRQAHSTHIDSTPSISHPSDPPMTVADTPPEVDATQSTGETPATVALASPAQPAANAASSAITTKVAVRRTDHRTPTPGHDGLRLGLGVVLGNAGWQPVIASSGIVVGADLIHAGRARTVLRPTFALGLGLGLLPKNATNTTLRAEVDIRVGLGAMIDAAPLGLGLAWELGGRLVPPTKLAMGPGTEGAGWLMAVTGPSLAVRLRPGKIPPLLAVVRAHGSVIDIDGTGTVSLLPRYEISVGTEIPVHIFRPRSF